MRMLERRLLLAIAFVVLVASHGSVRAKVSVEAGTDRMGSDYAASDLPAADPALCAKACDNDAKCKAYTYVKPGVQGPKPRCYLKAAVPTATVNACCVSGVKAQSLRIPGRIGERRTPEPAPRTVVLVPGTIISHLAKAKDPGALGRGKAVGSLNGVAIASLPKCKKGSGGNAVFDVLDKLAEWFGGDVTYDARCGTYERELAAGVSLGAPSPPAGQNPKWHHMGGAGDLMADAMICLMKDIGEAPNGKVSRSATTSVAGVGLTLTQHVGLSKFDPVAKRAELYQQQRVCAPLIGCMDTQRQTVKAQVQASAPAWPGGMKAGDYPVANSYSLDIATDWANTTFGAKTAPITIDTPYGSATLQPQFSFHSSLYPVDTPFSFKGSPKLHLNHPQAEWPHSPIVQDSYGRSGIPFILNVVTHYKPALDCSGALCLPLVDDPASPPSGWSSQIHFGARNAVGTVKIWSPAAGVKWPERPDLDIDTARSVLERGPSASFNAMSPATITPPVANLMAKIPSAVKSLIGDIGVQIVVTPRFDASFAGQLGFVEREGYIKTCSGGPAEFKNPCSLAEALLFAQTRAHGEMKIQSYMRFWIDFTFETPFFDPDIDKTINLPSIPLAAPKTDLDPNKPGSEPYGHFARASLISTSPGTAVGQVVQGLSGKSFSNIRQWTQQCLTTPPKATSSLPAPTHEPGKPDDLKPTVLPCNICVADQRQSKYQPFVFPEVKTKTYPGSKNWTCAWEQNLGCHDFCTFKKTAAGKTEFDAAIISAVDAVGARCKMAPIPIPR